MQQIQYEEKHFSVVSRIGHGVNDLYWFIFPLILPQMLETFGLSYSKAGGVLTAYLTIIAAFSFIIGKISDRYSKWKLLAPGFFAVFMGFLASRFTHSLFLFIVTIAIAAIGVSTFHPCMYALIDERTTHKRGSTFGMFEFWGTATVFVMFIINGTLLKYLHWKNILIITAVPALLAAILYFIGKPASDDVHRKKVHQITLNGKISAPKWMFALFLASIFTRNITFTAVLSFLPTYLIREIGVKTAMGTYASGFFFAGGMAACILAGKAGDKWGALPTILVSTILIPPSVALLSAALPNWIYFVLIFLFGTGVSACFPPQSMILTKLAGGKGSGETFGIVIAGMTIINAASPLLIGILADSVNLGRAILLFSIPALVSVILLVILLKSRQVKRILKAAA